MTMKGKITAVMMATLFLTACGGGGSSSSTTTTITTTSTTVDGATTTTGSGVTTTSQGGATTTTTTGGGVTTTTLAGGPLVIMDVVSFYPDPADGLVAGADLAANGISITFNEAVDGATLTSLIATLTDDTSGGQNVSGGVSYDPVGRMGMFMPDAPLNAQYYYTATVSGEIVDAQGYPQSASYSWQFQVGVTAPPAPPL
ncbi:MAG: Ig-like domain-containing protein [Proteobacteria bacterium]|nr:Ig-like domain-containing protein [Pseudomonadota bacterium]MBU1687522.1 Ig-like domain-containing protein [Pseudomonadota bacterium]